MTVTLDQFRAAWADKPNRDLAYPLADQYVAENAATLDPILGGKTREECVKLIDMARMAGNADIATSITIWELVKFDRQEIGAESATFRVRRPGG